MPKTAGNEENLFSNNERNSDSPDMPVYMDLSPTRQHKIVKEGFPALRAKKAVKNPVEVKAPKRLLSKRRQVNVETSNRFAVLGNLKRSNP
ncbi:hypothetical protein JTB14_036478 [Gonioctena quinquepunctata]|nr:hypothetical protein JTB14_036478 [Gonioctena quinquepunctata]